MGPVSLPLRTGSWAQWRLRMWIFIAVVLSLAFAAKGWLRQQYQAKQMRLQQQANAQASAAASSANRIIVQLQQLSRTAQSQEVIESKLAAYGPIILKSENPKYHSRNVEFNDAISGYRFQLRFHDGRLSSYGWSFSTPNAKPSDLPFGHLFSQIAPWISTISVGVWIILMIAVLNLWKHRRPLGEVLLALALLFGVFSQLDASSASIFRRDWPSASFWWGITMIGVSITLLLLPRRAQRGDRNRCIECNYDLTANASGRCPECGTLIPTPLYDPDEVARNLHALEPQPTTHNSQPTTGN